MNISHVIKCKKRIAIDDWYALIVPNVAAGKRRRYTVYAIPPREGDILILGREVPLKMAKEIAKRPAENIRYAKMVLDEVYK